MNREFEELLRSNLQHAKLFSDRFGQVQDKQRPEFVSVCCSDSRVLQDHMWGNEHPGEIFTCSNIGNRVFQEVGSHRTVSGDVLYPVEHTETENIIVIGHTGCGAVTATYRSLEEEADEPEGIRHCIQQLRPMIEEGLEEIPDGLSDDRTVNMLVEKNVDKQIEVLKRSEDIPGSVDVVGVVYDFHDVYTGSRGECHVINVNGEDSVDEIREQHPGIQDRVERIS